MSAPAEIDVVLSEPAPFQAVSFAATAGDVNIIRRSATIYGWFFRETTGSAGAIIDLYDGNDANSNLIGTVTLSSGEGRSVTFGPNGLIATVGVFVNTVAGTVVGGVWLRYT